MNTIVRDVVEAILLNKVQWGSLVDGRKECMSCTKKHTGVV